MSSFAYCKAEGLAYVHTPMTSVAHGEGEKWISSWNNFVNFDDGIDQVRPDAAVPNLLEIFSLRRDTAIKLVANDHFHAYCDRRPSVYCAVQDEFRRRCSRLRETPDKGVMAVHIRRGDVLNDPQNARRLTSLDKTAAVIRAVASQRPGLLIKVFSEGDPAEFEKFPADELYLNSDVFDTISALANAEILLMAKSSFSYVAALLSRGRIIYEPFWHSPLPTWIDTATILRRSGRSRACV
jgi:hypothetical protein